MRDGAVEAVDAGRILRHELRRFNTNRSHRLPLRSVGAQRSIDAHAPQRPPRNGSVAALHADHVHPFSQDLVFTLTTLEDWIAAVPRLSLVVCVTAGENYALERVERAGITGPAKYAAAGVSFATAAPWIDGEADSPRPS